MSTSSTQLVFHGDAFELHRYPQRRREALQAWCAADLLLLDAAHEQGIAGSDTLVVNDDFGALCLALRPRALWTDSSLSAKALRLNEGHNQAPQTPVIWSTQAPPADIALVLLRIPKSLPYFEYQLATLANRLPTGALVVAAGMDKHLSPQTATLMEKWLGPTTRHRGQKKARMFSAVLGNRPITEVQSGVSYHCPELDASLFSMANVFSATQLDIGSRFLLSELRALSAAATLVDLACGNGVLGLAACQRGLASQVIFCDESAMAIASARENVAQLFPQQLSQPSSQEQTNFTFHLGDGLEHCAPDSADLILCNPPFHLGHVVDDFAGRRLLAQCAKSLNSSGRLCLVANRHLDYRPTLKRDFDRVQLLASNNKFNILLAEQPRA